MPTTTTILLAEDEHAIAETVLYALRAEGYAAEHVLLGGEVLPRLRRGGIDLVIGHQRVALMGFQPTALGLFGASTWIGILIGYALWGIVVGLLLAGLAWYAPKLVEAVASALTSLR